MQDVHNFNAQEDSLYLFKNGKLKFIGNDKRQPIFSPDGKIIACKSLKKNEINLIDEYGQTQKTISLPRQVGSIAWCPDGSCLLYTIQDLEPARGVIRRYNLASNESELLVDLGPGNHATQMAFSSDGQKIAFNSTNFSAFGTASAIYICDSDGSGVRNVRKNAIFRGWYPDSASILFETNTNDSGHPINKKFGALFKMDLESGRYLQLMAVKEFSPDIKKLSRDGKYIYSAKTVNGGKIVVLTPLESPENEIPVTQSMRLASDELSQDYNPDWFQET